MRTSDRGIAALVQHEGIVPAPYIDSVGVWTFGIGHTAAAGAPVPIKMARGMPADLDAALRYAFTVFRADLAAYESAVREAVRVPLAQHEFDALVSFHFNTGAIHRAELVKALNRGDRRAAAAGFMNWTRPSAIIDRRKAEQQLFRDGVYPAGHAPVWQVTTAGKVIWKPVRTLSATQVVALLRPDEQPGPPPRPGILPRPVDPAPPAEAAPAPAAAPIAIGLILALIAAVLIYGGMK